MCIPVHSPWLPGHIDIVQTVLSILTMAGLFLERSHVPSIKADKLTKCSERMVKIRNREWGGRKDTYHEGIRIQAHFKE